MTGAMQAGKHTSDASRVGWGLESHLLVADGFNAPPPPRVEAFTISRGPITTMEEKARGRDGLGPNLRVGQIEEMDRLPI
jgi:hypothetical protein